MGRFGHQGVPCIHFGGRVIPTAQSDSQRCGQRPTVMKASQPAGPQHAYSKAFLNHTSELTWVPSLAHLTFSSLPPTVFFFVCVCVCVCTHVHASAPSLFFSKAPASVCVSVWPSCRSARLPRNPNRPPGLRSASPPACHCSALCTTLACFVNNHLFVAGIAAAITSDLPVSSIMERLLDVNICKSLLLNSPPG